MAVLITALVGPGCSRQPAAIDFTDRLTGPVSPAFSIPFEKYALSPDGLVRTKSDSGTENGIDRPVVKTRSGHYLSRDFVFEVDVTIPEDHGDIAYVGFGSGHANALNDNEPTDAYLFRIHNLPRLSFHEIDIAVADPKGGVGFRGAYRRFNRFEHYTPGRAMRVRIERRGGQVTLEVPSIAGVRVSFAEAEFRELFDSSSAYVFLGNSSAGTTFSNALLRTP